VNCPMASWCNSKRCRRISAYHIEHVYVFVQRASQTGFKRVYRPSRPTALNHQVTLCQLLVDRQKTFDLISGGDCPVARTEPGADGRSSVAAKPQPARPVFALNDSEIEGADPAARPCARRSTNTQSLCRSAGIQYRHCPVVGIAIVVSTIVGEQSSRNWDNP
jgi:hypothetical protein